MILWDTTLPSYLNKFAISWLNVLSLSLLAWHVISSINLDSVTSILHQQKRYKNITSWQTEGEKWKQWQVLFFGGSKIFIGRTVAEAEAPVLWPPDVKNQLVEKTLMLGKIEDKRKRGQQRMMWLGSMTDSVDTDLSQLWETVKDREDWSAVVHGVTKSQSGLANKHHHHHQSYPLHWVV